MDTGWNVAVLLLYTPLVFECFVKRKRIVKKKKKKCKQKISNTKEEEIKKMKTTPYVLSIKQ